VDLALDELEDGEAVLLVEWGDAVEDLLADERLRVELTMEDVRDDQEPRRILVSYVGSGWEDRWPDTRSTLSAWEVVS
jgi:tRNA A37 threonylcarbamoyladenosine biosynthesis protein TsaE